MPTAISEFTGEPVDTSSEAWRHECECRHVLDKMTNKYERLRYLYGEDDPGPPKRFKKGIEQHRGLDAAVRIQNDVQRLYQLRIERRKAQEKQPAAPAA